MTVLGNEGKVLFLKYGNMLRRVHLTKVVKKNNSFHGSNSRSIGDNCNNLKQTDENDSVQIEEENVDEDDSNSKQKDREETPQPAKRPSLLRCPYKSRKV